MSAGDVSGAAAGTLGAFLKSLPAGTVKTVTFPCIVASTDGVKATNSTLTEKPLSLPQINVNGGDAGPTVGDGTKAGVAFYFSADNGVTARSLASLDTGDSLYVNTSVLGYPLDALDSLIVSYRS